MNATIERLPTVTASKAEYIVCDEFDRHLDVYTSASYTYMGCTYTHGFVLNIFSTVFIAIVILILLLFGDGILRHEIKHNSLLFYFSGTSGGLPPTRVRFLTGEFCHQNDVILMKSAKTLLLTL
jgi:uncharacterized membrane protein